jgi:hypothetical protein
LYGGRENLKNKVGNVLISFFLNGLFEGPDKAIKGGEWDPIKIPQVNFAYVPNQTQCTLLLTQLRPHNYREAIGPQNQVRKLKSERKHKITQANS